MKKIILMAGCLLVLGGCSAMDSTYGKAKGVYKAGKTVYKIAPVKSHKIEAVGNVAEKYDVLREEVRGTK